MKPVIKRLLREQLLLEKDNREIIVNKMGLSQEAADLAHSISNKYSLWIAKESAIDGNYDRSVHVIRNKIDGFKKIIELFKIQNKPKTDINTLSYDGAYNLAHSIWPYIKDWIDNTNTPSINLTNMTWEDALEMSIEWHEPLKSNGKVSNILDDNSKIIHKFPNGYYWALTKSNYCAKSHESMGHCAEATRSDMYLLRLIKNDEEFVTADWHPTYKYIIQLKGKQNQKPIPKYYPYILWLISESGIIDELRTDEGYEPENNFQLSDLSENDIISLLVKNKKLIQNILSSYKDKFLIIKKIFELYPDSITERVIEQMMDVVEKEYKDIVANMVIKLKGEDLSFKDIWWLLKYGNNKNDIAHTIIKVKGDKITKMDKIMIDEFTKLYFDNDFWSDKGSFSKIAKELGENTTNIKQLLRERLLTKDERDVKDIADFVNFAKDYLGITDDIKIELAYERTPDLKTYAYYRIGDLIKVYVKDRNSGDIFRSLCHELVHHLQHLEGRLTDPEKDGADGSDLENEANSKAGEILRKWGKLHSEIYQ